MISARGRRPPVASDASPSGAGARSPDRIGGFPASCRNQIPNSILPKQGPRPSELYGKFTWRIDNFSQINMRELQSISFDVGGNKWYILIYPQGCDVCNHLSLFLCVANHDKLLPDDMILMLERAALEQ
ncbi:hypothetical protein ABZP36_033829 [Zizania latifolia]